MILWVNHFQRLRLVFTDTQRIFSSILTKQGVKLIPLSLLLVTINYLVRHFNFERILEKVNISKNNNNNNWINTLQS